MGVVLEVVLEEALGVEWPAELVHQEIHTIYLNNTNKTVKANKDQLVQVEADVIKKTSNYLSLTKQKQGSMELLKVEVEPVTTLVEACFQQPAVNLEALASLVLTLVECLN